MERVQVVIRQKELGEDETALWPTRVEASDSEWLARSRALVLMQRIADAGLRDDIDRLTNATTEAITADNRADASAASFAATGMWKEANERIGEVLRDLYPAVVTNL